jgi:3-deoxy-D-manno-octulosonic-acid transferase
MENFASLAEQVVAKNGAVCVQDLAELIDTSRRLLRDAAAREQLVNNALRVLQPHQEATARTAALIEKISTNRQV